MLIIHPENEDQYASNFCKSFLAQTARPRFVLGRNEFAASIAEFIDLDGFIDEYTDETTYLGKPIVTITDIPKDSLVVSVVVLGRPIIALEKLKKYGIDCLDYFYFLKYSSLELKNIDLLSHSKKDIENNWNKYLWIYNRLSDEKSKFVLDQLLNFRVSSNIEFMRSFEHAPDRQYFEDFIQFGPSEVFVDAGGYDGQTTMEFIKRCPQYKSVHFFEPDPDNLAVAQKNLNHFQNIHFYSLGLADKTDTLRLDAGDGSSSKLSETGNLLIHVDTIDNLIHEPITFIKMDIEGAEGIALQGAREQIRKNHPKMAICCYHKYDDLWKIPEQVLTVYDNYSLYLRHYTEGTTETVMFFVPGQ